jgi:hypothetical protein
MGHIGRAWDSFQWDPPQARESLVDARIRGALDLDDAYPYSLMLEQRLAGKNDSWAILWYWAVFRTAGLVIHPTHSLVKNSGFDGSGTHCGATPTNNDFRLESVEKERYDSPPRLPEAIEIDYVAVEKIKSFLKGDKACQ